MTTNVLDLDAGIAATDSRWSISTARFFVCIDDAGFEKILARKNFLLVFAGAGSLIQEWKDWAKGLPGSLHKMPNFSLKSRAVAITITDMDSVGVLFERMQNQNYSDQKVRFTGTGSPHAFAYWQEHHDALGAVQSAILMDRKSGGSVKYYMFDGRNNLEETIRFEELMDKVAKKGMIMCTDKSTELLPIQEVAKTNPEVDALVRTIESGEAEILSPCDEMYRPWTEEEKRRFQRVAENIAKRLEEN
jgi:hypothetical protein